MVHVDYFCSLPDHSAVDHSLVIRLNCRGVVQDHNFSLEIKDWLRCCVFVYQNHTLPESLSFQLFLFYHGLNSKANCLSRLCDFNFDSFEVYWLDLDRFEKPSFIRTQLYDLAYACCATQHSARYDQPNTSHLVDSINQELHRISGLAKLPWSINPTSDETQELFQLRQSFTSHTWNGENWAHLLTTNTLSQHGHVVISTN